MSTTTTAANQSTDVAAFLRVLHRPGDVFEVRAPKCPEKRHGKFTSTAAGYFNVVEAVGPFVQQLELLEPDGIYVTLNPVTPALLARSVNTIKAKAESTTADADILCRRCLMLDLDPKRPAKISSTGNEMQAALELAQRIQAELAAEGWPAPLVAMSGNGAYLLYRIDLPNNEAATELVKRVLAGLAARYDSDLVTVDTSTFNAARIIKLLGTMARKGSHLAGVAGIEDRPHRRSWFIPPAGELEVVSEAQLQAVAEPAKPAATEPPHKQNGRAPRGGKSAIDRCRKYMSKMKPAIEGEKGSNATIAAACKCFEFGLSVSEATELMTEWNVTHCEPQWSGKELAHKIADAKAKVEAEGKVGCRMQRSSGGETTAVVFNSKLPPVMLPDGATTITDTAEALGKLLATTGKFYLRGGVPMRSAVDGDGIRLETIRPAAACSDFESVAQLRRLVEKKEEIVEVLAICTEATARTIIEAQAFKAQLPKIILISSCPVPIERGGTLATITGYDRESGIWAMGEAPPEMKISEGRELLTELLADFSFASDGDRSRALAAFITPALVFGNLLGGRAPIDVGEADESQSGKGYRNKLTTAIYRHVTRTITQRSGGVGSLQESFDAALVAGKCFISFDNIRGKVDLPALESFATESTYSARVPYSSPIEIDTARTVLLLTSNRTELTPDLANRSSVVRIRKRGDGYEYRKFPEGDLLAHVVANQPKYLGAVFTVVREWYAQGKPTLDKVEHDFRRWAAVLGWIVERLLGGAPLTSGHRDVQRRMASPALNWLRDVALATKEAGKAGEWLRVHNVLDIVLDKGIETDGITGDVDPDDETAFRNACRVLGLRLSKAIRGDRAEIDGILIERHTGSDENGRERPVYRFSIPRSPVNAVATVTDLGNPYTPTTCGESEASFPEVPDVPNNSITRMHAPANYRSPKDFGNIGEHRGNLENRPSPTPANGECRHPDTIDVLVDGVIRSSCASCGYWLGNRPIGEEEAVNQLFAAAAAESEPDDYEAEERAAMMEYDAGLSRQEAERLAGVKHEA